MTGDPVRRDTDTGAMVPQAKECRPTRSQRRGIQRISPATFRERDPVDTLMLDLGLQN